MPGADPVTTQTRFRIRSGPCRLAAVASLALVLAGCGSAGPTEKPGALFSEYAHSTHVENDPFGGGGSGEDRIANFAAHGTPQQVETLLFGAYPCEDDAPGSANTISPCEPDGSVHAAQRQFAGSRDSTLYARRILVKHDDRRLELVTLYVARRQDGATRLVDVTGKDYPDGLDDFLTHNDILDAEDVVLTPRDITAVRGGGRFVVVAGHTSSNWTVLLLGTAAVLALAGAVVMRVALLRARRAARRRPVPADSDVTGARG